MALGPHHVRCLSTKRGRLIQMDAAPRVEAQQGAADFVPEIEGIRRELQASRDREQLLLNELAHRVRNILAITRSLFSRTVDTAGTLEHAADHFRGRLDALARYHARTASSPHAAFDLETMVFDELLTVSMPDDPRISVVGPEIGLRGAAAELMGLAVHELAVNSIKFGVLASEDGAGRLRVSWTVERSKLTFEWVERGVPIVTTAPMRSGFGREFIEQALPFQLGAESSFEIIPGGLVVCLRIPLTPPTVTESSGAQEPDL